MGSSFLPVTTASTSTRRASALSCRFAAPGAADPPVCASSGTNKNDSAAAYIARLVLVDAVVTGKKDEPIHGLTEKDFRIFEDGKEQTITGFQTHTGPATPGISQQQHFLLLFDGRPNRN